MAESLQKKETANPPRPEGDGAASLKQTDAGSGSSATARCETVQGSSRGTDPDQSPPGSEEGQKSGKTQVAVLDQREVHPDARLCPGPKPVGSGSSIVVSPRQVSALLFISNQGQITT